MYLDVSVNNLSNGPRQCDGFLRDQLKSEAGCEFDVMARGQAMIKSCSLSMMLFSSAEQNEAAD